MICTPVLLYVILCSIQIILDFTQGLYNTAFIKLLVTIVMTVVLNVLCQLDLGIISWIIVLIPFLFMTIIASVILVTKTTGTTNTEEIPPPPPIDTPEIIYTSPPLSPWLLPNASEELPQESTTTNITSNNTNTNNTSFPIHNGIYLIM
jgi:hypothetical protein